MLNSGHALNFDFIDDTSNSRGLPGRSGPVGQSVCLPPQRCTHLVDTACWQAAGDSGSTLASYQRSPAYSPTVRAPNMFAVTRTALGRATVWTSTNAPGLVGFLRSRTATGSGTVRCLGGF